MSHPHPWLCCPGTWQGTVLHYPGPDFSFLMNTPKTYCPWKWIFMDNIHLTSFRQFPFIPLFPWVYKLLILNLFFPCYLYITFWSCPHLCWNDVPDTLAFPFGCPTAKNMIMNLLIATICTSQFSGKCTHQCMSVQCLLKLCFSLFFKFSLSRFWWGRAVQCHLAYRILLPWWGIQPRSTAVKTLCPNHWSTREFPLLKLLKLGNSKGIKRNKEGRILYAVLLGPVMAPTPEIHSGNTCWEESQRVPCGRTEDFHLMFVFFIMFKNLHLNCFLPACLPEYWIYV